MDKPKTVFEYAKELGVQPGEAFVKMVLESQFMEGLILVEGPTYDEASQLWSIACEGKDDGEPYMLCVDDQLDPGNVFIF